MRFHSSNIIFDYESSHARVLQRLLNYYGFKFSIANLYNRFF